MFGRHRPGHGPCSAPNVVTAHYTLATALMAAKAVVAVVRERERVAALAWEHERTVVDTLARQLAKADSYLLGAPNLDPPLA